MEIVLNTEALVAAIRDVAGEALERVILHGSFVHGVWIADESDIDIAVLLKEAVENSFAIESRMLKKIYNEESGIGEVRWSICLNVSNAEKFERLRLFSPCYEANVLNNGRVLWACDPLASYLPLPLAEAKQQVVERGMRVANQKLEDGLRALHKELARHEPGPLNEVDIFPYYNFRRCAEAQAAACFALRAALYSREIDPSDKSMRWRVGKLLERLQVDLPEVARLQPFAEMLRDHYHDDSDGNSAATDEEARNTLIAAIWIFRFARQLTGYAVPRLSLGLAAKSTKAAQ